MYDLYSSVPLGFTQRVEPRETAERTFVPWQACTLVTILVIFVACLAYGVFYNHAVALVLGWVFIGGSNVLFAADILIQKPLLAYHSLKSGVTTFDEEELQRLSSLRGKMNVTLLIALRKEVEVVATLIKNLDALHYPKRLLEIVLCVDWDDHATQVAVKKSLTQENIHLEIVPPGGPRTKPTALNHGFVRTTGEVVEIFDAEDQPEPLQVLKNVLTFAKASDDVGCVQSRLAFHHLAHFSFRSPLTFFLHRMMAIAYDSHFLLVLPGLARLKLPIPLGGTSNCFRRDVLEKIGAWDSHCVAEDADLGVRLQRAGFRTLVIDSVTWETPTTGMKNFVNQRTRWFKGYLQAYLVHMRHPVRLYQDLGLAGFLSFQVSFTSPLRALLAPLYWGITVLYFLSRAGIVTWVSPELFEQLHPVPIYALGMINMVAGLFLYIFLLSTGCMMAGYPRYVFLAVFCAIPSSFVLSWAAFRAFWQLLSGKAKHWEKTRHFQHKESVTHASASFSSV